ncbi:ABC transporter permease [Edaphobacter dinghuensis]|nr:ABC transporter permease [Edaphobacter dinghuensis]
MNLAKGNDQARLWEELEEHHTLLTEEYIRAGMDKTEARRQATLAIGPMQVVREQYHAQKTFPVLENFVRDLRFAVRKLIKSPSFAIATILTMALGISATSLVFSVFYAAVVAPYPYRDANHIVQMGFAGKQGIRGFMAVNGTDFHAVRHASTVADAMLTDFADPITTISGYPEDIHVARMSGNAFDFLGVAPLFGRTLTPADRNQPFVVLGYRLCRSHFQCDARILGRTIDFDHRQFVVVGVMPPRFAWEESAAFIPLPADNNPDEGHPLYLRARSGVSSSAMASQMLSLVRHFVLANEGVALPSETRLVAIPYGQRSGDGTQRRMVLLFALVCVLLLIACANVSILLLSRTSARGHEFQMRHALGASQRRILGQVLVESVLIACSGGALGVGLACAGVAVLQTAIAKSFFPAEAVLTINVWVVSFSTVISVATGILFGLIPGLYASRNSDTPLLAPQPISGASGHRHSQRILIAFQVALTLVLLAVAETSIRSFVSLYRMNMGYDPHHVYSLRLPLSFAKNESWASRVQYQAQLGEALRRIPGVLDASVSEAMPTGGGMRMEYGMPEEQYGGDMDVKMPRADFEFVDAHYLSLLHIPVLSGRPFLQTDLDSAEPVAIVNKTFARRLFGEQNPLRRTLRLPPLAAGYENFVRPPHASQMVRIIGIAGDVRDAWMPGAPARETIYLPESLFASPYRLAAQLRTTEDSDAILETARHVIAGVNRAQPVSDPRKLDEILSEDLRSRDRWLAILAGAFSASALFLAAMGLYSTTLFAAGLRMREFGLRVALGAARWEIFRLVLFSEVRAVTTGVGIGVLLTLFIQRVLLSVVGLAPIQLWFLIPACLGMLLVCALANSFPARQAAYVEPNTILRSES